MDKHKETILLKKDIKHLKQKLERYEKERIIFRQVVEGIQTFVALSYETTRIMKSPLGIQRQNEDREVKSDYLFK